MANLHYFVHKTTHNNDKNSNQPIWSPINCVPKNIKGAYQLKLAMNRPISSHWLEQVKIRYHLVRYFLANRLQTLETEAKHFINLLLFIRKQKKAFFSNNQYYAESWTGNISIELIFGLWRMKMSKLTLLLLLSIVSLCASSAIPCKTF